MSDFPGFIFSSYQQTAPISFVLVSMKEYERIMKRALTSSYAATGEFDVPTIAPRRALYVRVHEAATVIQREDLVNQLRNFVQVIVVSRCASTWSSWKDRTTAW